MLLITTALPVIGEPFTQEKSNDPNPHTIPMTLNIQDTPVSENMAGIFIQLPPTPEKPQAAAYVSDSESGYKCFDDFWDLTAPICDIHWWGNCMYLAATGWELRDPTGMKVNITFYMDDGAGKPGPVMCHYPDVSPTIIDTGIKYMSLAGFWKPLYYFETILDPCCQIPNGWVSIQSTSCPSGGWLMWMHSTDGNNIAWQLDFLTGVWMKIFKGAEPVDLSFILTDGEAASADLDCRGSLSWVDVKPGDTVTGNFDVANIGDPTSVLQWKIDETSLPSWGTNWTFTPSANFQTPGMGWLPVVVSVEAPPEENKEFTGNITVVNILDSTDICEIPIKLVTPTSTETTDSIFGWTIIRGFVGNLKKQGNDLYFRAIRLHYTEITGMEMSTGVIRLKRCRVSDIRFDRHLTFGPLGSFTWIFGYCHGGLTEL
jgi:hypothetical protein